MKNSLIIFCFFLAGVSLGYLELLPESLINNDVSSYVLYALMFVIGIGIGSDKESLKVIKEINYKILLVPFGIILGTFIGSYVASLFIAEHTLKDILAVGSGFGYYSLSSIFITELRGETLGVIALLTNIIREILTLFATPLLVKYFGPLSGIASGGATSMDTTLPIIVKYSGKEWAIISIFSGIVLTILVPFIVNWIL